jgi:hypothetical protein
MLSQKGRFSVHTSKILVAILFALGQLPAWGVDTIPIQAKEKSYPEDQLKKEKKFPEDKETGKTADAKSDSTKKPGSEVQGTEKKFLDDAPKASKDHAPTAAESKALKTNDQTPEKHFPEDKEKKPAPPPKGANQ